MDYTSTCFFCLLGPCRNDVHMLFGARRLRQVEDYGSAAGLTAVRTVARMRARRARVTHAELAPGCRYAHGCPVLCYNRGAGCAHAFTKAARCPRFGASLSFRNVDADAVAWSSSSLEVRRCRPPSRTLATLSQGRRRFLHRGFDSICRPDALSELENSDVMLMHMIERPFFVSALASRVIRRPLLPIFRRHAGRGVRP